MRRLGNMESVDEYEYSKKDLIGHGAFAVVFKGRRKKKHDHVVAIKAVTKKNLAKSQNLLSKEIKILKELSSLHHDNVVALLDCKETTHHVYLVMEYCNGGDLADYLQAKGTLSEDTIGMFLKQIAGAMKALNDKGIVHRDLKPQNLLLCHSGKPNPPAQEIILKIADFGFARFLQDGVMAATLCGSPMYMAPEVIMSLQYDAKADLWSIGTIVFQCLTGKAPFQAQTPQQLKHFYEKNAGLAPNIPSGTSPALRDLLLKILKRNARDRVDFDAFFNHPFLASVKVTSQSVPVPGGRRHHTSDSSPKMKEVSASPLSGNMLRTSSATAVQRLQGIISDRENSPKEVSGFVKLGRESIPRRCSTSEEDFVMVPEHVPADPTAEISQKNRMFVDLNSSKESSSPKTVTVCPSGATACYKKATATSPSRPSDLNVSPTTQAIPVPSQTDAYEKMLRNSPTVRERKESTSSTKSDGSGRGECIPRKASNTSLDVGSVSPANVRFTIGTPPSCNWKRSSSVNTPPKHITPSSPARMPVPSTSNGSLPVISDYSLPISTPFGSARTRTYPENMAVVGYASSEAYMHCFPGLSSPNVYRSNTEHDSLMQRIASSNTQIKPIGFGSLSPTRPTSTAMPLTPTRGRSDSASYRERRSSLGFMDVSSPGSLPFAQSPPNMQGRILFEAPGLDEGTIMDHEHNETMSKLNFVVMLAEAITKLAQSRSMPVSESMHETAGQSYRPTFTSEAQRCLEQLVLYVKILQILQSALELAKDEIKAGRLQPSNSVRSVVKELHTHYHHCLDCCKHLQGGHFDSRATQMFSTTADRLIYNYAIEMCQTAALGEMFGSSQECFHRYQTAQILLHSLAEQAHNSRDRQLLLTYRENVEKRIEQLQVEQGHLYFCES